MGVSAQELIFLHHVHKYGDFKKTVTIGSMGLFINKYLLKKLISASKELGDEIFADQLLKDYFGATVVDSIDKSDYEGATIIHDMNLPIPDELREKYDTVFESGTLEHIYNMPQALENTSSLCKPGGQIIHILPANNVCGHGFWQVSPELFYSLYSDKNGYRDTEVYLARMNPYKHDFYRVLRPENGKRIQIYSKDEIYAFVRTVRKEGKFSHNDIQQSDYVYLWNSADIREQDDSSPLIKFIRNHESVYNLALTALGKVIYVAYNGFTNRSKDRLSDSNPNLVKVDIPIPSLGMERQ